MHFNVFYYLLVTLSYKLDNLDDLIDLDNLDDLIDLDNLDNQGRSRNF